MPEKEPQFKEEREKREMNELAELIPFMETDIFEKEGFIKDIEGQ